MSWREFRGDERGPATTAWPAALPVLIEALGAETAALLQLTERLVATRRAFAAVRPSTIASTAEDLQPLVDATRREAARRTEAAAAVCRALGLPDGAPASRMAPRLQADQARRLLDAVATARTAAHRLKVENAVGSDLLDIAARAQDSMWRRLGEGPADGPELYDQRSQRHRVQTGRSGGLVDGHL